MLIKTEIPGFKKRTIYPTQSNDGTISVPSRTLCPTEEVANGDFLFFDRKRLGPESCYENSTKGVILFLF